MKKQYQIRAQRAINQFQEWANGEVDPIQLALPTADMLKLAQQSLGELLRHVGKLFVDSVLEAEVEQVAGQRSKPDPEREAYRWGGEQPITKIASEDNALVYVPLGVGGVIPPWNFPLAIMAGMTTAAVATGNCVILKPSSDAPWIAWRFFALLEEAARPRKGQLWIKRVVAEMGGKDAIIVDRETGNLDQAAADVVASAFGFQGQKCSACSRAIVHEKIYDEFVERLKTRTEKTVVGAPEKREVFLGPVVSARAEKTILEYIEVGTKEGRLITGGEKAPGPGYFIEPTVIADVKPTARIAQEEIFGPVLAVTKAKSFEDAVEIANGTIYGLTGAYYSRDKAKLAEAKRKLFVGNLYLNRKCTGALVGIHPFGGFNMSGTDSKAGGRDYLGLFMQGKSIAEKV